jgi:hypothetical protein
VYELASGEDDGIVFLVDVLLVGCSYPALERPTLLGAYCAVDGEVVSNVLAQLSTSAV